MWINGVYSPEPHVFLNFPGIIPECRDKNKPWASLGLPSKQKQPKQNEQQKN